MKKILGLLLLLVSFTSYGQFVNYTNINGRYKWIAGKFDSTFTLPSGTNPSLRTGGGTGPGALFYNTADSIVYQYTGSQWRPLHGSDTGRIQIAYVRNTTASQMTTGQVVYINGSTGNVPTVALAQNKADSSSAMTFGFVRGTIAVNGFGWITTFGPIDGINTNAYTEGEVIYLDSVAGQFTHSKPQAPYHMVTLGYIVKKSGNGIIFTKIQNGYELEELHNVKITGPVLNKSVIIYDSVKSLWVDTTVSAAGLGLGGSGTTNYLSKWTSSSALGNSLVFDNGTSVGVNTASPSASYLLDVNGAARTSNTFVVTGGTSAVSGVNGLHIWFSGGSSANIEALQPGTSGRQLNLRGYPITFMNSHSGGEMARFTTNGRLLIGTTTESTYELDVVGDIRSTLDANINGLTVGKGGGSVATSTAIGFEAMNATVTGAGNVAVGYRAGKAITSGVYNAFVGYDAGISVNTGSYNYGFGMFAGRYLTSGSQNVLLGFNAGAALTTQGNNVFIGHSAGDATTAGNNVGIGYQAMQGNTTGTANTTLGYQAGYQITTGGSNTAIGSDAGRSIATGTSNAVFGRYAGYALTSSSNTAIGAESLISLTTGANNTAIGYISGRYITAGTGNITSGNSVYLGYDTRASADGNTNETVIGYQARGNGSNSVTLGNTSVTKTVLQSGVLVGTTTSAGYALDVNGTARVSTLTTGSSSSSADAIYSFVGTARRGLVLRNDNNNTQSAIAFNNLISGAYYSASFGLFGIGGSTDLVTCFGNGGLSGALSHILASNGDFKITGTGLFGSTSTPNASAVLEATSTTKGFLPPRMTGAQAEAIATPAAGLLIYCNNGNGTTITSIGWWGYDGTNWVKLN